MSTSEQARADAMADAETLRQVILTEDQLWMGEDIPDCDHIALALYMDRRWTQRAINKGRYNEAYMRVSALAHAAFRAVPGLRGK